MPARKIGIALSDAHFIPLIERNFALYGSGRVRYSDIAVTAALSVEATFFSLQSQSRRPSARHTVFTSLLERNLVLCVEDRGRSIAERIVQLAIGELPKICRAGRCKRGPNA